MSSGTTRANSNTDLLMALSPFKTVVMEVSDEASILEAARQLEGVPIDLLINNAGIYIGDDLKSATKDSYDAPVRELAAKNHGSATVAQVSSFLGSIGCNTSDMEQYFGQSYMYAASKVALNMVSRSMSVGLRDSNIAFVVLNPGYVDTDMNNHQGYLKPSESAEAMANIVANLSMKDTGKFFNADKQFGGLDLPW
ncbi:hypothetical protein L914_12613 [Phytophthora nicotianae]|uniref:C-factor n=2 Tax=Phytophthora nicotianae TaxID=4792 RepID=V9ES67_PHYNI|nr:hypothetical protein F443_13083 [Phytophthora nicotianae P1569]ETM41629.1 hypothetical protein L914_12613 [Phytophthora nicotianae]